MWQPCGSGPPFRNRFGWRAPRSLLCAVRRRARPLSRVVSRSPAPPLSPRTPPPCTALRRPPPSGRGPWPAVASSAWLVSWKGVEREGLCGARAGECLRSDRTRPLATRIEAAVAALCFCSSRVPAHGLSRRSLPHTHALSLSRRRSGRGRSRARATRSSRQQRKRETHARALLPPAPVFADLSSSLSLSQPPLPRPPSPTPRPPSTRPTASPCPPYTRPSSRSCWSSTTW